MGKFGKQLMPQALGRVMAVPLYRPDWQSRQTCRWAGFGGKGSSASADRKKRPDPYKPTRGGTIFSLVPSTGRRGSDRGKCSLQRENSHFQRRPRPLGRPWNACGGRLDRPIHRLVAKFVDDQVGNIGDRSNVHDALLKTALVENHRKVFFCS